ncbi:MAG: 50S ribosomal protein L11 methyltransferase [Myxococcales bacterium]|nr:50S ribosomal protein L11 methyltransferase [Myxococcales bacterium]
MRRGDGPEALSGRTPPAAAAVRARREDGPRGRSSGARVPRFPEVHVDVAPSEEDTVVALLHLDGARGVEVRDASTLVRAHRTDRVTLVAAFEDECAARNAAARLRALGWRGARFGWLLGDAWRDGWREHFRPTRIGARLVVHPPWAPWTAADDDVPVCIDPAQAFGTGTHESTRLVLRELDRRIGGGERVLDVGCGSGILAIAALRLGARRATAIDVDPEALVACRENARRNDVASRLRVTDAPLDRLRGRYDTIVANIEARVLLELAAALTERLAPGGALVLSGLLRGQQHEIRASFGALRHVATPVDGDWVALVLAR